MTFAAVVIGPTLLTEVWHPASQRPTLEVESRLHEVAVRPSTGVAAPVRVAAASKAVVPPSSTPIEAKTVVAPVSTGVETVLRWQPTSNATYYNVVVWHDGKRVLDIWPRHPHVKLPHAWNYRGTTYRLEPGRYLWFVFPYLGQRGRGRFVGLTEHGVLLSNRLPTATRGG